MKFTILLSAVAAAALLAPAGCSDEQISPVPAAPTKPMPEPPGGPGQEAPLIVHYYRPLGDYTGWRLVPSGDTTAPAGVPAASSGSDKFGSRFTVPLAHDPHTVRISLKNGDKNGDAAQPAGELTVNLVEQGREVWVYSDAAQVYTAAPAIPADGTAIIYYRRADEKYSGWGLHAWNDTTDTPTWTMPIQPAGRDAFGSYYVVHLKDGAKEVGFTLHNGDTKDPGPDMTLKPGDSGRRIWVLSGDTKVYTYPAEISPIDAVRAHWVTRDTIAWNLPGDVAALAKGKYTLRYAPSGEIHAEGKAIVGGQELPLSLDPAGLGDAVKAAYPQLASYKALRIGAADRDKVPGILKGQLLVTATDPDTGVTRATGLQIPGVLDDLYAYAGALGVVWSGTTPTLKLWAPTARSVSVQLFADAAPGTKPEVVPMSEDSGVWSVKGTPDWKSRFYLYDVEVFVPSTGRVEHNVVTDPYSISLSANSARSQIVDLGDPALKPAGWDALAKPALPALEDSAIYELHVRDFSANDASVPAEARGTFMAFAQRGSNGMKHLAGLASAGLTHIHLLPVFDVATIPEVRADQKKPGDLSGYAPDSDAQQAAIEAIKNDDAYNWGYDPFHFTVPEGSYATDPDGPARIVEFRTMVKALSEAGLRVVMDVVYNHTHASGQAPTSVLDKVVPGYYHRLDDLGAVATSTCCQNTATEHVMMEKLMIDSLVTWATAYKVDGFRFDLMGHHMKSNMLKVRDTLAALTPAKDGVDGASILLYGEGWDFGEVANNARGINATQANMAGTGIGTFNDRLRDAVRGGGPFDSGEALKKQGFINGLSYDPNALDQGSADAQKAQLLLLSDHLRIGLTGNLRDYRFEDAQGNMVTGADVMYGGAPTGYTLDPREAVTYVSAHDNQTLFDALQYKAPDSTSMEARVRMQNLGISIVALGQGLPFFDAGIDMLRSKSLDRDSFDSGDWFNQLDFTYASNNWGVGLPLRSVNEASWPVMKPLLADPARKPAKADILRAVAHMQEVLRIRKSSPLFRLHTGDDVKQRLRFFNTGPSQLPGVVAMAISDDVSGLPDLDPALAQVVIVFNATATTAELSVPELATAHLTLHPIQQASSDPVVGTSTFAAGVLTIPARTTAVFVERAATP